ncbi:MAG: hypothetical protein K2Q32_02325 [Alphaproteobacteria bacterium]|nr:hypothetical protein [Alphaproteobacteria bacterium]
MTVDKLSDDVINSASYGYNGKPPETSTIFRTPEQIPGTLKGVMAQVSSAHDMWKSPALKNASAP